MDRFLTLCDLAQRQSAELQTLAAQSASIQTQIEKVTHIADLASRVFGLEDRLMLELAFEGRTAHAAHHRSLLKALVQILTDAKTKNVAPAMRAAAVLEHWAGSHARAFDRALDAHIQLVQHLPLAFSPCLKKTRSA